jgi:hypothetical protein
MKHYLVCIAAALGLLASIAFFFYYSGVVNRRKIRSLYDDVIHNAAMFNHWCYDTFIAPSWSGLNYYLALLVQLQGPLKDLLANTGLTLWRWTIHTFLPSLFHFLGALPNWTLTTAFPFVCQIWTSALSPLFKSLFQTLFRLTLRLLVKIGIFLPLRETYLNIHFYYLTWTLPRDSPTYTLAEEAATTPLRGIINILQQNDALGRHIDALETQHEQEIQAVEAECVRRLECMRKSCRLPGMIGGWEKNGVFGERRGPWGKGVDMRLFKDTGRFDALGNRVYVEREGEEWETWCEGPKWGEADEKVRYTFA